MRYFLTVIIVVILVLIIQIITAIIFGKRQINIYDNNIIEKIKPFKYKYLEIKRKRRAVGARGNYMSSIFYECSLEHEFPIPWSIMPPEDIIEIYGVDYNSKKYLIFSLIWSKDAANKIKNIVEEVNRKMILT
jgi:hypothetical protein